MKVSTALPPMWDEIRAAFPQAKRIGAVFTWGDTIYRPFGEPGAVLDGPLRAHEAVHCAQQGTDPAGWWRRYIADASFRYAQELPAYRAQYRQARALLGRDRAAAFGVLRRLAADLAGPLYGQLCTVEHAMAAIARP